MSEETGTISIVYNGQITRNYSAVSAEAELNRLLATHKQETETNIVKIVIGKIVKTNKGKDEK